LYNVNPPPPYPGLAGKRGYQGTVLLHVLVDERGLAAQIDIESSSGHGILDRAATEAVQKWQFQPGRRHDLPVAMWVRVPVRFRLQ
jgi:protein TonB